MTGVTLSTSVRLYRALLLVSLPLLILDHLIVVLVQVLHYLLRTFQLQRVRRKDFEFAHFCDELLSFLNITGVTESAQVPRGLGVAQDKVGLPDVRVAYAE